MSKREFTAHPFVELTGEAAAAHRRAVSSFFTAVDFGGNEIAASNANHVLPEILAPYIEDLKAVRAVLFLVASTTDQHMATYSKIADTALAAQKVKL